MRIRPYLIAALLLVTVYALDYVYTNDFHKVVTGEAYRSGQLKPGDIARYERQYQIRSILNLRGDSTGADWYDREVREARAAHIQHIDFQMFSGKELSRERALQLIQVMRDAPKPILIHCRGGTNRTGLASALYLAAIKKDSEFVAELQLSMLYGHVPLWFTRSFAMNRTFEALEPILGYHDS